MSGRGSRGSMVLWTLAVVSVVAGTTVRVVVRGASVPGWDLIAPAHGHFLAVTRSVPDAIIDTFWGTRFFWLPFPAFSLPFALVPGYLTLAWPWPYWTHVVVPIAFLGSLALIGTATGLRWRDRWVLPLAWGASPMLSSYALAGMPWASGILPHALALVTTMSPTLSARLAWTIPMSLLAIESAWHCYDVGRSVGIVFVVAAALRPAAPARVRVAWLLAGAWSLVETLVIHRTTNLTTFGGERLAANLSTLAEGLGRLGHAIGAMDLDLPALGVLGLLAFVGMRRDRRFVGVLLALQVAAVIVLAMPTTGPTADALRPRRLILLEGYSIVALACCVRDVGRTGRRAVAGALLLANLWQHAATITYVTREHAATYLPMPFTESAEGIGFVSDETTRHAERILGDVRAGRHVLLAYNLGCYPEGWTNPVGLIERVYLTLGHATFTKSVSVFGSNPCRYACLPIRAMTDLAGALAEVKSGVRGRTTVYRPTSCDPPQPDFVEAETAQESQAVFAAIEAQLRLEPLADADASADHFLVLGARESRFEVGAGRGRPVP